MSEKRQFKALDLFCKAGGVTKGLQRAGFYVVGVDIEAQPRYCGDEFVQADALTFPLDGFDFIHASPPCQFGSEQTPMEWRARRPNHIPAVRERLLASGAPYMIENVENVRRHLLNPVMLCGTMFGLRCWRHRYFECNFPLSELLPACDHRLPPLHVAKEGSNSRRAGNRATVKNAPAAFGIDWMVKDELVEAIPPAYSEFLGRQATAYLIQRREMAA